MYIYTYKNIYKYYIDIFENYYHKQSLCLFTDLLFTQICIYLYNIHILHILIFSYILDILIVLVLFFMLELDGSCLNSASVFFEGVCVLLRGMETRLQFVKRCLCIRNMYATICPNTMKNNAFILTLQTQVLLFLHSCFLDH